MEKTLTYSEYAAKRFLDVLGDVICVAALAIPNATIRGCVDDDVDCDRIKDIVETLVSKIADL